MCNINLFLIILESRTYHCHIKQIYILKITTQNLFKQKRVQYIKSWISQNQNWERTIFSDEKWFSLDDPDDWKSYMQKEKKNYHTKGNVGAAAYWFG